MFGIDSTELLLVALVALLVIGPSDLPKAMRVIGHWVGKARGVARHFRSGLDEMVRQSEMQEMEKRWAEENERIMREHPPTPADASAEPDPEAAADAGQAPFPDQSIYEPAPATAVEAPQSEAPSEERPHP